MSSTGPRARRAEGLLRTAHGRRSLPDRLAHNLAVGEALGRLYAGRPGEDTARALGILHDIGYFYPVTGFHPTDGAEALSGGEFADLAPQVAWHSTARYEAAARDTTIEVPEPEDVILRAALWVADFTTSPTGTPVTLDERVREIRDRYPSGSPVVAALDASLDDLAAAERMVQEHLA